MKKLVTILIIFLGCIFLGGCSNEEKENNLLDEILKNNNYIIVDVRTKEEYEELHVKDAINIPYDQIDENTELDKSKIILVYCKSGVRSNKAYNSLKELGYEVFDLGAFDNIELEKGV